MEFKKLLKDKRTSLGITQQALANAIFVSRSAVAKWESGLGIPSRESYEALLKYFGVGEEEFPLNEEKENRSVGKNKIIKYTLEGILFTIIISLTVYVFWLTYAIGHGYGFTSDMAVGDLWSDNERIDRGEYVFYYGTSVGELKIIDSFAVAERRPIGYQRLYFGHKDNGKEVLDENGDLYGYLLSFKGRDKYYHIFRSTGTMYPDKSGVYINLLPEVVIKEETIEVLYHSYFETNFELTEFYCEGKKYTVK